MDTYLLMGILPKFATKQRKSFIVYETGYIIYTLLQLLSLCIMGDNFRHKIEQFFYDVK